MIEGKFDSHTLAVMNIALDRVCAETRGGQDHAVRKRIAREIVRCADSGHTALDDLVAAGRRGLARAAVIHG